MVLRRRIYLVLILDKEEKRGCIFLWNWRHEEYGMVNRDKAVVGLGGDL